MSQSDEEVAVPTPAYDASEVREPQKPSDVTEADERDEPAVFESYEHAVSAVTKHLLRDAEAKAIAPSKTADQSPWLRAKG